MTKAAAGTGGGGRDEDTLAALTLRLPARIFQRRVRLTRLWLAAEKLSTPERQGVLFPPEPADAAAPDARLPGESRRKAERLLDALDRVHARYGDEAVRSAIMLEARRLKALPPPRKVS